MTAPFQFITREMKGLIDLWEPRFLKLSDDTISNVRNSQDRSIRQIVGHMVDSASNNTHRIIHLHYRDSPVSYPDYANLGNNDRWIQIQNYQEEGWGLLVALWASSNRHLAHVIDQVDQGKLQQKWVSALQEEISLEQMIVDYPRHLKLHLEEVEALIHSQ